MASEMVDPINWSHTPPSWAVPPELHVLLHGVNSAYKSQDLLQQPGLEHVSTGMPDQRTACASTRGTAGDKNASHCECETRMSLIVCETRTPLIVCV